MAETRPFVDRRLGLQVLLTKQPEVDLTAEEGRTVDNVNTILDDMGISAYVTQVQAKNNPPQMKVIFNEAAMQPEILQSISSRLDQAFTEVGGNVQTVQVTSVALSPGNKVRNAIGI